MISKISPESLMRIPEDGLNRKRAPLWASLVATFFGIGYLRPGPGTWGSATTVLLWWLVGRWIAPAWQRTAVNTEAKYLMLRHAFEVWKCNRVELKTDSLNQRSRNAILRIGAKEEGTFRNHMVVQGGRVRHTVYFSIIDSEWPGVKKSLEERLSVPPGTAR